jgi:3-hydroxy acid dehydrogenase / malonic semialdehyde reductase
MRNKAQNFTLITGASAGIGEATALSLAENKYSLILTARRLDRLKALQKKCLKMGAKEVLIFALDVQKPLQIKKIADELKKKKIKLKTLINNAGLAKGTASLQNTAVSDIDVMLDTNVKGLLYVTRELLPMLIESRGHIVNIGSVAGRLVYEGGLVYAATKFAVRAVSESLRLDLKGTGVRVTTIAPGMVETEFSVVRLGNQQKAEDVYKDMMPLTAMDIANSILWCLTQPPHVNISELVLYPTDQASVGHVVRGEKSIRNLK